MVGNTSSSLPRTLTKAFGVVRFASIILETQRKKHRKPKTPGAQGAAKTGS
jgi:hypothetical protein